MKDLSRSKKTRKLNWFSTSFIKGRNCSTMRSSRIRSPINAMKVRTAFSYLASLVDYMKSQHSRVRSVKLNRVITQTSQPTQNTASPLKILNPRPSTCFNRQRSRVKVSQSLHQSYK